VKQVRKGDAFMGMHLGLHLGTPRRPTAANVLANVLVPVFLVWGLTAAAPAPAHAAPQAAQRAAAVTEGTKVTLPETSIAGPGFTGTEIVWAGTDAAHHLNVATGPDGLHFPTKITLPETSPFASAVTLEPSEGSVINFEIAWTGSDPAHHLNVESFSVGTTTSASKMTLPETSIGAPAIIFNGNLLLAWTGTDANHSLNVLQLAGPQRGQKTVLRQFSSDAGPSLAIHTNPAAADTFVLGWSVRGTQRLNLATSTDGGAIFSSVLGSGLPQTSAFAPQFSQPSETSSSNGCIAWTGTDAAHHLNVQCTSSFPQFPNPAQTKTVLPETALGAPGFIGLGPSSGGEIAWTGTDRAHHLNVAVLSGV
jgi:hypothetical protein